MTTAHDFEARRIDGGEQFFTRAVDFGYSKSAAEALSKWGEREILADELRREMAASILRRMSLFWQRMFLTVGIVIAVFGMRLVFPLLIVWATTNPRLGPVEAIRLALNPPTDGSKTYEEIITAAHPQIAAFGGMFLLMLFLDFALSQKERTWISWIEKPLARAGLRQVQRDAALVAVQAHVVGRHTVLERWAPGAGLVALRGFDLEHVGPMVGQDLAAVGSAQHARQVDDADTGQCAWRRGSVHEVLS